MKALGIILLSLTTAVLLFVAWFFISLPNPHQIKECLVTEMFKVDLCEKNKNYVRIGSISKYLKDVVVISEDSSFYQHQGLDWFEIENSFKTNLKDRAFSRGGSTITQQLVKNVFLTGSKNPIRKLKEAYLAYQVEKILDKKQILEKYLNVVEFGPNIFGVSAASRHYFKKHPSELNILEAAFLAYLLPSPKKYSQVYKKGALTSFSRRRLLDLTYKMYRYGRIQQSQYFVAREAIDQFPWQDLDPVILAALDGAVVPESEAELPISEELVGEPIEADEEILNQELTPEEEVELENSLLDQ